MSVQRHFVTDRRRLHLSAGELVTRARAAVAGGIEFIQVREFDLPDVSLAALVRAVLGAAAGSPTRVLVNDRVDVALVCGAHGVHLRGDSAPAPRVRAVAPAGFLIGRSVHSSDEADAAVRAGGCDYLTFGTIFPSSGKAPGHPVAGLDALRDVCRRSALPVVGIGGITALNAGEVLAAGAAGYAAVGMFL